MANIEMDRVEEFEEEVGCRGNAEEDEEEGRCRY